MNKTRYFTGLILFMAAVLAGCVDNNETDPPVVEFKADTIVTVQQVKALYADQLAISDYKLRVPVEIIHGLVAQGNHNGKRQG